MAKQSDIDALCNRAEAVLAKMEDTLLKFEDTKQKGGLETIDISKLEALVNKLENVNTQAIDALGTVS